MQKLHSHEDKRSLVLRLKRIEGQLRGIQQLIETEEDCEAIAQQLAAARRALDKTFHVMIACALDHQLAGQVGVTPGLQKKIENITAIISRYA
jgi:CsoR family transcriptional regulator, copper-sensing transcriptional repressor